MVANILPFKSLGSVQLKKKKNFSPRGHIKLIKNDSKDIYILEKKLLWFKKKRQTTAHLFSTLMIIGNFS